MQVVFQFEDFPEFVISMNLAPYFERISRETDSASGELLEIPRSRRVFSISRSMDFSSDTSSGGSDSNGTEP